MINGLNKQQLLSPKKFNFNTNIFLWLLSQFNFFLTESSKKWSQARIFKIAPILMCANHSTGVDVAITNTYLIYIYAININI